MNKELNLFGIIQRGKLIISNREQINEWVKTLPEGSDIIIKFRNQDEYVSNRQLRLIYSLFRVIGDKLGYGIEDIKTILKMRFGHCYTHNLEGSDITICKSLSEFNKKEMSDFIMKIDQWTTEELQINLLNFDDISFLKSI